ncbi:hypothetical protein [Methylobacterium sp. D48H]
MQEFQFWYDVPVDPNVTMLGPVSHLATSKCLLERIHEPWIHPLYIDSTLPDDIAHPFAPVVGMEIYKLDGSFCGIMVKITGDPERQIVSEYRCLRRLKARYFEPRAEFVVPSRPWIVVTTLSEVMRGETTRAQALRNAYVDFDAVIHRHDPGALPEGEDLEALAGLG